MNAQVNNKVSAITLTVDPNHVVGNPVTKDYPASGTTCFGTCTAPMCSYANTTKPASFLCGASCPQSGGLGLNAVPGRWNAENRNVITDAINLAGTINYFYSCCSNQYMCADGNGGCVYRGLVPGTNPWYMCLGDTNNQPYYAVCNANTYGTGDYTTLDYTQTTGTTRYYCTRTGTAPNYNYAWSTTVPVCSYAGANPPSGFACVGPCSYANGGTTAVAARWNPQAQSTITDRIDLGAPPYYFDSCCADSTKCADNTGACYSQGQLMGTWYVCANSGGPYFAVCNANNYMSGNYQVTAGGTPYYCKRSGTSPNYNYSWSTTPCTPQCPAAGAVACGQTITPTNGCGTCGGIGTYCSTGQTCSGGTCITPVCSYAGATPPVGFTCSGCANPNPVAARWNPQGTVTNQIQVGSPNIYYDSCCSTTTSCADNTGLCYAQGQLMGTWYLCNKDTSNVPYFEVCNQNNYNAHSGSYQVTVGATTYYCTGDGSSDSTKYAWTATPSHKYQGGAGTYPTGGATWSSADDLGAQQIACMNTQCASGAGCYKKGIFDTITYPHWICEKSSLVANAPTAAYSCSATTLTTFTASDGTKYCCKADATAPRGYRFTNGAC